MQYWEIILDSKIFNEKFERKQITIIGGAYIQKEVHLKMEIF